MRVLVMILSDESNTLDIGVVLSLLSVGSDIDRHVSISVSSVVNLYTAACRAKANAPGQEAGAGAELPHLLYRPGAGKTISLVVFTD